MTIEERIDAMEAFCERHDMRFSWSGPAGQREPDSLIAIDIAGVSLQSRSADSLAVAVARMENALTRLGRGKSDEYLHAPHDAMGRLP